jgi:hypothetical protein
VLKHSRDALRPGRLREVSVISGLPASTSTERLDLLDDASRVFGFSITGSEHRLTCALGAAACRSSLLPPSLRLSLRVFFDSQESCPIFAKRTQK